MVVFIMGLATGLVVLTLPPRASPEQAAAKTFAATLNQAQDRAILSGQSVGLRLNSRGYELTEWRAGQWVPLRTNERLGRGLSLVRRDDFGSLRAEDWPDLIFDPTGVVEGISFDLRGRGDELVITVQADGDVIIDAS